VGWSRQLRYVSLKTMESPAEDEEAGMPQLVSAGNAFAPPIPFTVLETAAATARKAATIIKRTSLLRIVDFILT